MSILNINSDSTIDISSAFCQILQENVQTGAFWLEFKYGLHNIEG